MPVLNPLDLTGQRFLVTGASSGIGRETSLLLSELGASVVLVGRDGTRLQQALASLSPGQHTIEPFNLQDLDEIPAWMLSLASKGLTLNGCVHSAGIHEIKPLRAVSASGAMKLLEVNVLAGLMLAKGFRQKQVSEGGSIVFLSSATGLVGQPALSAYSASKGAVIAMTRSLAMELARENIRVNCVTPSIVETEMTKSLQESMNADALQRMKDMHPLGFGEPRDVAHAIAFLLSPMSRWITGSALVADGGYTAQ